MKTKMTKTGKAVSLIMLSVLMVSAVRAETDFSEANGSIGGLGFARTHDFPVIAEKFSFTVSDPVEGSREITFTVNVKDITTENRMRDRHMWRSIFETKDYPQILFRGKTDMLELKEATTRVEGNVEINGISRPLGFDLQIQLESGAYHARGAFTLQPTSFDMPLVGMGPMKLLDKVDLNIDVQLSE